MIKPELLIPAGSLEVLKTAVNFGADAVYIGGEAFGLRAKAKNFSPEDMAEGIAYAHDRGVKAYVTANILAHNGDLEAASDYFMELKHLKTKDGRPVPPDALIISDPGLFMIAKRVCPEIELHISTQGSIANAACAAAALRPRRASGSAWRSPAMSWPSRTNSPSSWSTTRWMPAPPGSMMSSASVQA